MARPKKQIVGTWVLIGIVLIGGFLLFGHYKYGWLAFEPEDDTVASPNDYTFYVYDEYFNTLIDADDHSVYLYRVDISELTSSEIEDLTFADYTLHETLNSGDTYQNPDEDKYLYWAKANGTDYMMQWKIPIAGDNPFYLVNQSADDAMLAFSTDELSTTVNQTNYDKWSIFVQCLDAAEATGLASPDEGYKPYYDFETDDEEFYVAKIEFNTTAVATWCKWLSSEDTTEVLSTVYIYYEIDETLIGSELFDIQFNADLIGVDFEVIGISIGYGNAGGFTALDTQN